MANLLFAQRAVSLEEFDWIELAIVVGSLIAVGLAAGATVLWVKRWASRPPSEPSANQMLSEFKRLKAQGELSDEEYRRIRNVLDNKIRVQAGMAPAAIDMLDPLPGEAAEDSDFEWQEVDLRALESKSPLGPADRNGRNVNE